MALALFYAFKSSPQPREGLGLVRIGQLPLVIIVNFRAQCSWCPVVAIKCLLSCIYLVIAYHI